MGGGRLIGKCRHCDASYWRFRKDHPPSGFCSLPCSERHAGQKPKQDVAPDTPDLVMRRLKDHNRLFHNAESSMIAWNCKACDRLQEEYAESLTYHFPKLQERA
jgi:hypothetical protein